MALGYFFLTVFCLFTSPQSYLELRIPLMLAALLAALIGLGFFVSACAPQIQAIKNWFLEMVQLMRLARELPPHPTALREETLRK